MPTNALCSIAVFHDGSYVSNAQRFYYGRFEGARWLDLGRLHALIEHQVQRHETTYERHCVTYAAWFQGISQPEALTPDTLKQDRKLQHDLMKEGIHPTLLPMSFEKEKGVDVALAISAMEVAFTNRLDFIALVTGDADFVPLVWALKRRGMRVGVFGFDYDDGTRTSKLATALRRAANFCVDLSRLERDAPDSFTQLFSPRGASQTPSSDSTEA